MKLNSAIFLTLITLGIALLTASRAVSAEIQASDERWFEIEVILFNQLGDKSELKETFPDGINASQLPNYQKSFDLLGAYLQPNQEKSKKLLSLCYELNEPNPPLKTNDNINNNLDKERQQLEQALADIRLSTDVLCAMSLQERQTVLKDVQLPITDQDLNAINALPAKLKASGEHNQNGPYLISDNALLLKDVRQKLRWSKTFKPLLHFGWRQIGITKKSAVPLKLFAGEHITYKYQQALASTQAGNVASASGQQAQEEYSNQQKALTNDEALHKLKVKADSKQHALSQLFSRLYKMNEPMLEDNMLNETVSQISEQRFDTMITHPRPELSNHQLALKTQNIAINGTLNKPLQPWFLDGFIKIHLDHYLYITADFNIYNQQDPNVILHSTNKEVVKLINFSQNRRVITGEIHYFDHPYLGMVVQIRRFDPSQPVGEQVSQAVK